MIRSDPTLTAVIEAGAEDLTAWPEALTRLADHAGADGIHYSVFSCIDGRELFGGTGRVDPAVHDEYAADFAPQDLRLPRIARCAAERFFSDRELLTANELRHSAVHQEFLPRHGCAAVSLARQELTPSAVAYIAVGWSRRHSARAAHTQRKLESYLPSLRFAARFRLAAGGAAQTAGLLDALCNSLGHNVILLNRDADVLYANDGARTICAGGGALVISNAQLEARATTARQALHRALRSVFSPQTGPVGRMTWSGRVVHPNGRDTTLCHLLRIRPASSPVPRLPDCAALLLYPQATHIASQATLCQLYGFSPAEAQLVRHLCDGATLEQFAAQAGIAMSTARTHLRGAFAKTGINRQGALIAVVCREAGSLVAPVNEDE